MAFARLGARAFGLAANALWPLVLAYGERFPRAPFQPRWAPAPLQRKKDRTSPPLGWPRRTDSLCPVCVREARTAVLSGKLELDAFIAENPGAIPAEIVE